MGLSIGVIVLIICLNTLSLTAKALSKLKNDQIFASDWQYIHIYFQEQLADSDVVFIKAGKVYLQDMETSTYYNTYYTNGRNSILYRQKHRGSDLKPIGSGQTSQMMANVQSFTFQPEHYHGEYTGNFILEVVFKKGIENEKYEARILYFGGKDKIIHL